VNITTGNATSYYYFGGRLVAMSENGTMKYYPFAVLLKRVHGITRGLTDWWRRGETLSLSEYMLAFCSLKDYTDTRFQQINRS
jgi:hypothetical protein